MVRVYFCVDDVTFSPSGFMDGIIERNGGLVMFALHGVEVANIEIIRAESIDYGFPTGIKDRNVFSIRFII